MGLDVSVLLAIAAFVLGWIGREAYQFYKNEKRLRDGTREG